ncbi:multiple cyclophane-containing RiPP AmcA [Plantactinospora soyae]|uniref:Uncharacterized protein n=1 Tax=Plantactinospora soyae TaxID=1544732 RepID=A0A927M5M2_9ACTN|nr:multiple cyclophane-containing RiPP AmcA [Plantactinospora soyae]MBE1485888.1 hypothetical protein [Plantactinospora soyae]
MPEITSQRPPEHVEAGPDDLVAVRVQGARAGLATLLQEAAEARRLRAEVASAGDGTSAVCAWNHFENIPTFYNWNNRPR